MGRGSFYIFIVHSVANGFRFPLISNSTLYLSDISQYCTLCVFVIATNELKFHLIHKRSCFTCYASSLPLPPSNTTALSTVQINSQRVQIVTVIVFPYNIFSSFYDGFFFHSLPLLIYSSCHRDMSSCVNNHSSGRHIYTKTILLYRDKTIS